MKSKALLFVLSVLSCCSVQAMHKTYYYNLSDLTFNSDTIGSSIYERVTWKDCLSESNIGHPELPIFMHREMIDENIVVDSVSVTLQNTASGILPYPIMPVQYPIPTGITTDNRSFVLNDSIYSVNTFLPQNDLIHYQVGHAREGKYITLTIAPFHYNPVTRAYTVSSVAEVEIFTHNEEQQRSENGNRIDIGIPYYEYVIVTSVQLRSAFEPFAEWKRAKGYEVGIVNISDILNNSNLINGDELSNIVDDAGKLRQYLIYSYNTKHTKYVLLGGDSSIVPIRYAKTSFSNDVPTDFYYSELSSNWDTNNNGIYGESSDHVDYGAEIYVGRLLCSSADEVRIWTQKVLQYEINPGEGDYSYLGRALFTQADQMQRDGEADSIQQKLSGNISCTIHNEYPSYDSYNPTSPIGADIITAINNTHYGLLGNFNHGANATAYNIATNGLNKGGSSTKHVICAMDYYDTNGGSLYHAIEEAENGFDNLTNSIYPAVMYSISCYNMPFDQYQTPQGTYNLGRVYTCRITGGGPAYLGNTRDGLIGYSTQLYGYFLDSILCNAHNNHIGIAEAKSKIRQMRHHLCHSHNILGCPEMSLYMHVPNTFDAITINNVADRMIISTGADSIESRICLSGYINGVFRQFVFTDRSHVAFDTIPETYTLVVSMPNYIPYILTNDTCYLQNDIITNTRTYSGCSTFRIGSNVSSLKPYGNVTINNGGNVVIYVGDSVTIKNDFEVKLGGKLEIR